MDRPHRQHGVLRNGCSLQPDGINMWLLREHSCWSAPSENLVPALSSRLAWMAAGVKSCRLLYGCMHTNPGLSYDFCCHQESLGLDLWIYGRRTRLPITECDSGTNRERYMKNI
jgi:hypothetical protein